MAFLGMVLYPAKHKRGGCHETHRKDIMVDGARPTKSVSPSQPMLKNTTYRARGTPGVNP
jgi:hypothetical protein